MTDNRRIDGELDDDQPYPMSQVVAEKSLVELKNGFVHVDHWSEEYTGLEIHLDGAYNPLLVHGTKDGKGNDATVGSWLSVDACRELGDALHEAADRVEAAREQDEEPDETKESLMHRAMQAVTGGRND